MIKIYLKGDQKHANPYQIIYTISLDNINYEGRNSTNKNNVGNLVY